jgi:hypothetical protein
MSGTHTYVACQMRLSSGAIKRKANTVGALVQTEASIRASFKTIEPSSRPRILRTGRVLAREPRAFPESPRWPTLPMTIRDEMQELLHVFCQGGSRQRGMTFEQFLLIAAAIKPPGLPATREDCSLLAERRYL